MNSPIKILSKLRIGKIHFEQLVLAKSRWINLGGALLTMAIVLSLVVCRAEDKAPASKILPLFDRAVGDLNGDGKPDRASIIQKHDQGDKDVERTLIVELGQANGWKKILETQDLTPAYPVDYVLREELFPPSVSIEDNKLWIYDGITKELGYKLEKDSFVLDRFSDIDHSRVSDWFEHYELHLDVGLAVREYDPPSESEKTPPAWCPWAAKEQVNCRYPQVPVVCGEEGKTARKLELMPTKTASALEVPLVTSWANVEGDSIRIHLRAEMNGAGRFEPVVKNLNGEVLTPVSSEQRRNSSGTSAILEFNPNHFGLKEEWKERMETFREKSFAALELPCVLEVTVTPDQGSSWRVTSNPGKAKYAAPFVLMPTFVCRFSILKLD